MWIKGTIHTSSKIRTHCRDCPQERSKGWSETPFLAIKLWISLSYRQLSPGLNVGPTRCWRHRDVGNRSWYWFYSPNVGPFPEWTVCLRVCSERRLWRAGKRRYVSWCYQGGFCQPCGPWMRPWLPVRSEIWWALVANAWLVESEL